MSWQFVKTSAEIVQSYLNLNLKMATRNDQAFVVSHQTVMLQHALMESQGYVLWVVLVYVCLIICAHNHVRHGGLCDLLVAY